MSANVKNLTPRSISTISTLASVTTDYLIVAEASKGEDTAQRATTFRATASQPAFATWAAAPTPINKALTTGWAFIPYKIVLHLLYRGNDVEKDVLDVLPSSRSICLIKRYLELFS